MSEEKVHVSYGPKIGFSGLLGVLFIGLKLTGHITWSWFWVLSPLWIPLALFVGFLIFMLLIVVIGGIVAAVLGR